METQNGLIIHRADLERGGFNIELNIPASHGGEGRPYAIIQRSNDDRWEYRGTFSPNVVDVINEVDAQYGRTRAAEEAEQTRRQAERDRLNESFAPHWAEVVANYGGEDDATV